MRLEIAGKGVLFATAISLITAGSQLIESNLYGGIALLVVGVALVVIWAFLIDYEARREGERAVREAFERFKVEMERKRHE
jgi:hypothetical protein